jgi:5-methylcytosine-specific restriction endonuclease McrA
MKYGSVEVTSQHDVDLTAERLCRGCGCDISHKRSNAVFCSRDCKNAGTHQRLRATPEGKAREAERNRARYEREADRRKAEAIAYYYRNQQLRIEYAREWRKENPHRRREQAERRATWMVENPGFVPFGSAEWEALKRRHDHRCAYCGVRPDGLLEKDHVVPLVKGGRHAIANILPACKDCNGHKSDLLLAEWKGRTSYPRR